jgi:membrane peptidoglycan carboxypeptidase
MGQEVSLNALQLARITAVVANGGKLVQPHVVTKIVEPDGSERALPLPEPTRVLSEATAQSISRILVGVVQRGTGTPAAIPGFLVAGKTGTAQKAGVGGYGAGRHVPNFAGFAPADHPRCVAVVVLEDPQGKYYSAEVAAPLFAKVMAQALGILRVAPREQQVPRPCSPRRRPRASRVRERRGDGGAPRLERGRGGGRYGRPDAERSRDVRPRRPGRVRPHRGLRAPAGLRIRRRPGSASGLAGSSGLGPHPFPRR